MAVCSNCGNAVSDEAKFCTNCGQTTVNLAVETVQPDMQQTQPPSAVVTPEAPIAAQVAAQQASAPIAQEAPPTVDATQGVAQPQQGNYTPQPQQGNYTPQPQQGNYTPQPQQGNYTPQPQQGNYTPQPQQGNYTPQPQQGNYTQQPPQQNYYAPQQQQQNYYAQQPGQPPQNTYGYQQNQQQPGPSYQSNPADIAENKGISVLCYLGLLLLIPLLTQPNSGFVKYHSNQGLTLVILSVIMGVLMMIPYLGIVVLIFGSLFILVCVIMGIINVVNGQMKPLPLIGKITLLK